MLSPEAARDKAMSLVELARKKGADAADAVYVGERSQSASVRLGQLEDVHRSEGEEVGLRVFAGRRNATDGAKRHRSHASDSDTGSFNAFVPLADEPSVEISRAALPSLPRTGPATGLGVDSGPATGLGADTGLVSGLGVDTGLISGLGADAGLVSGLGVDAGLGAGRGEGPQPTTRVSRRPGRPVAPFPSNPSTPAYGSVMQTVSGYGSAVPSAPAAASSRR